MYTYILVSYDCKYMTVINLYNLTRKYIIYSILIHNSPRLK